MNDVAVFPIPGCVVFPGTELPLHIFEPRYRQMVHFCLEQKLPMAICHSQKLVHSVDPIQSMDDALHHNQDTYKPVSICSSGPIDLLKTLRDGRLFINVRLEQRCQLVEEVQTLPFLIYSVENLPDYQITIQDQVALEQLKDKILHRLLALAIKHPELQQLLRSPQWQHKAPHAFSFELFGLLQMNPDHKQEILSMRSPVERLQAGLSLLNQKHGLMPGK